jgi:integrase
MITNRVIQALQPGEAIWDEKLPGFGARRQTNAVSYVLKYRVAGVQRFVTLGRHGVVTPEEARRKARQLLGVAAGGSDPIAPKSDTVGAVIQTYLAVASSRQRHNTFRKVSAYLQDHWRALHGLSIVAVRRRDVALALADIERDHSPIVAARARTVLHSFFSWAIREGFELPSNPVAGTNRPAISASRDRVLSAAELRSIWRACNDHSDFGRIVRLLMLTAQRRDEIGKLQWPEIEIDVIRLPPSRTKNAREHLVPLVPMALSLLPDPILGRPWVFGMGSGFSGYARGKEDLDKRSGVSDWRTHDIRRSVATGMADLGVLPHIIEAVLNHASGHKSGVAGIYNRSRYLDDCRAALLLWSNHIAGLIL